MSEINTKIEKKVEPLKEETYIQMITNSVGTTLFKNFFANIDGNKQDVMGGGELSCAYFVSAITTLFQKTERMHATVSGTIKDLESSGWVITTEPKRGDIIVWEQKDFEDGPHSHIGFFMGNNTAISNSSIEKVPIQHHITFNGARQIETFYTYPN